MKKVLQSLIFGHLYDKNYISRPSCPNTTNTGVSRRYSDYNSISTKTTEWTDGPSNSLTLPRSVLRIILLIILLMLLLISITHILCKQFVNKLWRVHHATPSATITEGAFVWLILFSMTVVQRCFKCIHSTGWTYLPAADNFLVENAELIPDAISISSQTQRGHGVQETSCGNGSAVRHSCASHHHLSAANQELTSQASKASIA